MAKVTMIVMNPVTKDARVLKEARTLREAGYAVKLIGLMDNKINTLGTIMPDGLEVSRVDWKSHSYELAARALRKPILVLLLAAFVILSVLGYAMSRTLKALLSEPSMTVAWLDWLIVLPPLLGIAVVIGFTFVVFRRLSNLQKNYAYYKARQEKPANPPPLFRRLGLSFLYKRLSLLAARAESQGQLDAREQRLTEAALETQPDIIHCHDIHTLPCGIAVKRAIGAKLVYDAHELYEDIPQASVQQKQRYIDFHREAAPQVDGFITINDSFAELYRERYPRLPEAAVVRNATIMVPDPIYDGRLHDAAGLDQDRKILLFQGGFAPRRGIEMLVEAAPFLPDNWSIVLMGWGALQPYIEQTIEKFAREDYDQALSTLVKQDDGERSLDERVVRYKMELLEAGLEHLQGQKTNILAALARNPSNKNSAVDQLLENIAQLENYESKLATLSQKGVTLDIKIPRFDASAYDKIRLVPAVPQDELVHWTAGGTVGIIPYENFGLNHWLCNPNKLWEFPNANVPCLVSPFPELRRQVLEHDIGWVLPPDVDSQELGRFIGRLTDNEIAEKRAATRRYKQIENWGKYESRLLGLYERLTASRLA